jgi:hypothetical protein
VSALTKGDRLSLFRPYQDMSEKGAFPMSGPNPFNRLGAEHQQREEQEREQRRSDFNTPLPVRYIVISITIVLLIIVGVVLGYTFHFW